MPTVTELRPIPRRQTPNAPSLEERRSVAPRKAQRVRSVKLHLAAFAAGTLTIVAVWAMTELEGIGGWPNRMNEQSPFGSWDRWGLWIVLAWGSIVAVHALIAYALRERRRQATGPSSDPPAHANSTSHVRAAR